MGEYAVEKEKSAPKNFLLVIFQQYRKPTVNAAIKEYAPVMIDAANDNKIIPVAKGRKQAQSVLLRAAAGNGEPVTYYMTGEFFADALALEAGADLAKIKEALRKVSIFLR
ncbi:MAG: hypothetical protein ACLRYD_17035 [Ruminococcus callidus]